LGQHFVAAELPGDGLILLLEQVYLSVVHWSAKEIIRTARFFCLVNLDVAMPKCRKAVMGFKKTNNGEKLLDMKSLSKSSILKSVITWEWRQIFWLVLLASA
jgi:hypothetical protein